MKTNEPFPVEFCPELMAVIRALEKCEIKLSDGFDDWINFGVQGFQIENSDGITAIRVGKRYFSWVFEHYCPPEAAHWEESK